MGFQIMLDKDDKGKDCNKVRLILLGDKMGY